MDLVEVKDRGVSANALSLGPCLGLTISRPDGERPATAGIRECNRVRANVKTPC